MHSSILFLSTCLLWPILTTAQWDKQSYCEYTHGGPTPNTDACLDIKNNGIKDDEVYGDDEWWSGNCKITVYKAVVTAYGGSRRSIPGTEVKEAVQNIMDNCDNSGFVYSSGIRVDVTLCWFDYTGVSGQCLGPLQRVRGFLPQKRRHLTDVGAATSKNAAHVLPRQDPADQTPYNAAHVLPRQEPGDSTPYGDKMLTCGGGPGSAEIDKCKALADEVRAERRLKLPWKGGNGDCHLFIYPTTVRPVGWIENGYLTDASHIAHSMYQELEVCADSTKTIVGWISNFMIDDFHFFYGKACGAFDEGFAEGCFPAGR